MRAHRIKTLTALISAPATANIPDITFTLINNNGVASQSYDVRMGLIIRQQGNATRRLEASVGVVRITTDGSGNISGLTLLNTENLQVNVRDASTTMTYSEPATNVNVLSFSGATVTVSPSAINNALTTANPTMASIVNALTLSGNYDYRLVFQPVAGSFKVGTTNGADFTAFARMQSSCSLSSASTSGANFVLGQAASFSAAYAAHGILSLNTSTAPSAGFSALTEDCGNK